jgi:hypothetical protein
LPERQCPFGTTARPDRSGVRDTTCLGNNDRGNQDLLFLSLSLLLLSFTTLSKVVTFSAIIVVCRWRRQP